jgi:hypothetical protein
MLTLRLIRPTWARPRYARSTGAAATLTLSLALVTGLVGCDEKAPTSTEPAAPVEVAATSGADDGSGGALLAMGNQGSKLVPLDQDVATTTPAPAFRINQTGTGPSGIFQISPTTNAQNALHGLTSGIGHAGLFEITNSANTQAALLARTNGAGFAVQGVATGTATAGSFEITDPTDVQPALVARTNGGGFALEAHTSGGGAAFLARSTGDGGAGLFLAEKPENPFTALQVTTTNNQFGVAFIVQQLGTGYGGIFALSNPASTGIALQARTEGTGEALRVDGRSLFMGDVTVNGTLTKSAGSFRIDHPLDPEHKYLSHSFVESPDMMNVYNGNVALDASGRATVALPEYFEALNREFRYQLTAIGSPGPDLYIAQGVKENRFQIAGGRPYAHVSWQVTGVRHDAYAEQHRIQVEEDKPQAERDLLSRR